MAFESFVQCDRDGCGARQQVPQQGAIPKNWIQVRYVKPGVERVTPPGQPAETTVLTLCGWRCLFKHAKTFVRDEVEVAIAHE